MDEGRFDALTRVLGAARTRRGAIGALAALFGGTAVAAAKDADSSKKKHRRRKKRCNPKCAAAQSCDRKSRSCVCRNGGSVCGPNCCLPGTRCEANECVPLTPTPACHEFGSRACNGTNVPCCGSDLTCASGQGGKFDVACYKRPDAACTATSECVYGTECRGGTCKLVAPPVTTCNGSNCNGCCSGTTCVPFTSQTSTLCGTAGATCASCTAPNTTCSLGICELASACDPSTCPSGCCRGRTCVLYADQNATTCGVAGGSCTACASPATCSTTTGVCA